MRARLPAETVYLIITGSYSFCFSAVLTVAIVYQTQTAGLTAFQLVVGGAATQLAVLLFEVPTGVMADMKGRRLSVVAGMTAFAFCFVLMGASTSFWTILTSLAVMGVGLTCISGAQEAWIADEVGVEQAGRAYLRSSQTMLFGRLAGIPAGVGLGLIDLHIPLIAGGACFAAIGLFAHLAMSETGFARPDGRTSLATAFRQTLNKGFGLVRTSPILISFFAMVAFYETAGEVFNRLNVAHFIDDIGFPTFVDLEPVVWFGAMRMVSALAGLLLVEYVRRTVDTTNHTALCDWLLRINFLQMTSLLAFAVTPEFWSGLTASLAAINLSRAFQPLYIALVNMHAESNVRATVISMSSQCASLGQVVLAPAMGVLGSSVSVTAALFAAGLLIAPAMALNLRARTQGAM